MGIGFDKSKVNSTDTSQKSRRRNNFDLDAGLKTVNKRQEPRSRYVEDDEDEDDFYNDFDDVKPKRGGRQEPKKKSKAGLVIVILFFIIICLLIGGFFIFKGRNQSTGVTTPPNTNQSLIPDAEEGNGQSQQKPQTQIPTQDDSSASGTLIKENDDGTTSEIPNGNANAQQNTNVSAGLPNFNVNTNMNSDSPVTDYSKFTNTIDGKQVDVNFKVSRIDYKQDFVNYTKYRGVTGTGLEVYWLEANYKGRPYLLTIPFKIYKELDAVGIVPVTMEVLVLSDNSQIISHMEVNTEYKGDAK